MTLTKRLSKLVKILKNEDDFIVYKKEIKRLKFHIMRILWIENLSKPSDIYLCQLMADGQSLYLEISDITTDELESIVKDLEDILING